MEEFRKKDAEEGLRIAQVLEGFIGRKVVKQTVMTVVYGVTRYGGRLQMEKRLKEIEFPEVRGMPQPPSSVFLDSVPAGRGTWTTQNCGISSFLALSLFSQILAGKGCAELNLSIPADGALGESWLPVLMEVGPLSPAELLETCYHFLLPLRWELLS